MAASIGYRFRLVILADVLQQEEQYVRETLEEIVSEGLILPVAYDGTPVVYEFFHDHVQTEAYDLLTEHDKEAIHYNIGYRMLAHEANNNIVNYLPIDQLNRAGPIIKQQEDERIHCSDLNQMAGMQAKQSGSFDLARHYFRMSTYFLIEEDWTTYYHMCFSIYLELSECEYLCGDGEAAEHLYDVLLQQATSWIERAQVYGRQVTQYALSGEHGQAVHIGVKALREAGITIPDSPRKSHVLLLLWRVRWLMPKRPEQLSDLPEVRNQRMKMVMELLSEMIQPSFLANKPMFAMITLIFMKLVLKHGRILDDPTVFAAYSILESLEFGDRQKGYAIGETAVSMADESSSSSVKSQVYVMFGGVSCQWVHHGKESLYYLQKSIDWGLQSGNYVYAGMAVGGYVQFVYTRDTLEDILTINQDALMTAEQIQSQANIIPLKMYAQFCRCLKGDTFNSKTLTDDDYDEAVFLKKWKIVQMTNLLIFFVIIRISCRFII